METKIIFKYLRSPLLLNTISTGCGGPLSRTSLNAHTEKICVWARYWTLPELMLTELVAHIHSYSGDLSKPPEPYMRPTPQIKSERAARYPRCISGGLSY